MSGKKRAGFRWQVGSSSSCSRRCQEVPTSFVYLLVLDSQLASAGVAANSFGSMVHPDVIASSVAISACGKLAEWQKSLALLEAGMVFAGTSLIVWKIIQFGSSP